MTNSTNPKLVAGNGQIAAFISGSSLSSSSNDRNPFRPVPFMISRVDVESRAHQSTLPIIIPAVAKLTLPSESLSSSGEYLDDDDDDDNANSLGKSNTSNKSSSSSKKKKKKKNFTQLAKNVLSSARGIKPKSSASAAAMTNDIPKAARSYTTAKSRFLFI